MPSPFERQSATRNLQPETPLSRGVVLTLSIVIGLGALAGLWLFARPLALLGIAVVIGEALRPLADRASRGLPRPLAVAVLYLTLAVVLITALWFALAPLAGQAQQLLDSLPALIERGEMWMQRQDQRVVGLPLVEILSGRLQGLTNRLLALPMAVASSLFDLLLVIFLSLYWLLAAPALGRFVRSLFPVARHERVAEVQGKLSRTVGGYFRGVAINVLLVAVVTYVALRLIGLPFPLILAVIAGLFEVIPFVGPFIAGALIVAFALSLSWQTALITLAFIVALQQFEGNLLTPMVMRSQTDLHPFLVLVAIVLGGGVGGLLGAIVAIPLAGAIKVLVVELLAPALRRRVGASPAEAAQE